MSAAGILLDDFWILKPTRTPDGGGGFTYEWEPAGTPMGRITKEKTRMVVEHDQRIIKPRASAVLEEEACDDLDESCAVMDPDGQIWEVDGISRTNGAVVFVDLVMRK